MRKYLGLILATTMFMTAPAYAGDEQTYDFSMSMTDNGVIIAEPQLEIALGEPVEVHIEPGDGRVYRALMTFDQTDGDTFQLTSTFDLVTPEVGVATFTPTLEFTLGEPMRVEYGNEYPGVRPFRAEILLSRHQD